MEKECGHYATQNMKLEHILSSVFCLTSYRLLALLTVQQNTVLDYELFKPNHAKSSQSQVMSKQVNSQWKFKDQKFSYRSLPNVLRTSILLNKLTQKLRDVQAVRGGVLWEPAGLKTGSAAGAFFR